MNAADDGTTRFIIDEKYMMNARNKFYDKFYLETTKNLIRWRTIGATQKCESILILGRNLRPTKVVDIGAGTCSVIARLAKMKFAPEFYVIEISPSVIEFIRNKVKIPELKAVFLVDSSRTGLEEDCFDLGILSHVLEHVAAPIELLQEALRISKYVILEVPLEDCLLLNLFSRFKEGISGIRRDDNPTGHIRFFSRLSVKNLIVSARGVILSEWNYFPSLEAAVYGRKGIKKLLSLLKHHLFTFVFKLTGSRIVDSHYAVLLKKRCN